MPLKRPVRQMVIDAVEALGGATTNVAVRDWILTKYPGTQPNTIQCQLIAQTVNHPSRVHYGDASKPRIADPANHTDKLFRPAPGQIELYDPQRHGTWAISVDENGRARVELSGDTRNVQLSDPIPLPTPSETACFAAESHLRDYLALNLSRVEPGLELFSSDDGVSGVEFRTPIGRIDILARDAQGGFVVIELKVSHGPDDVSGQILRYVNWVRKHMSGNKPVRGIIIAQHVSEKILYSIASDPLVSAMEYELSIVVRPVKPI